MSGSISHKTLSYISPILYLKVSSKTETRLGDLSCKWSVLELLSKIEFNEFEFNLNLNLMICHKKNTKNKDYYYMVLYI